jgi:hypothetical protein
MRHFIITGLVSALFALPVAVSACGGGGTTVDADPFDTFELCWQEHHVMESFTAARAIEICCIDHPIGPDAANVVCGDTVQTCETYVTASLAAGDATTEEITEACTNYVPDRAG